MDIFSSFLLLAAISTATSQLPNDSANETTGLAVPDSQLTTQQPSTSHQMSKIQDFDSTSATRADGITVKEERSSAAPLQPTQNTPPATLPIEIRTEATLTGLPDATTAQSRLWKSVTMVPTSEVSKQVNGSTETPVALTSQLSNWVNGSTEPTVGPTNEMSDRVNGSTEPATLSIITQSLVTVRTSTSHTKLKETTSSFTSTSEFTTINAETTTFKPESTKSTGTKPSPGGDGVQSSTSEKPTVYPINKAKKDDTPHGKIVAAVIGAALLLMILGFLVIFIYKQRHQKKQQPSAWAGPSPFLEGDANNGNVELRSSNRISLTSFLPQRLSKRLSLLQDPTEMKEIPLRDTFEEKHQGSTFGQTVDGNAAQEKSYKSAAEIKSGGEAEERVVMTVIQTSV
ncbi:PREDICTED: protein EVI2B [Cyprinodon variegatus]|uniref:protein EVI2B n=1 Tax=Cyprinodon variegatus TaxID=28743 RepID=UPI000742645C|nr:PREDICTED: protein EVI2B [Cyprinodon variegatus]